MQKNYDLFKQTISYGSYGTQEAREQLSQITAQLASAQVGSDVKQEFLTFAGQQMLDQEKASPLDARFPLFLGILLDQYGDYTDATTQLALAHNLSPRKQSILYAMAQNAAAQGDKTHELQYFADAYNLLPEDNDARLYYAAAAIQMGNDQLADSLLAPITPSGAAADARILNAYMARKRYDKIIPIWQAHIAAAPNDMQAYYALAAVQYASGDPASAINTLQKGESVSPSDKAKIDQLILDIKAGKSL